jgi:DNA-binding transcriptional regulator YiaG
VCHRGERLGAEPMTPDEIRSTLARLELTTNRAAQLVGVDDRTMRKWLAGERGMPEPVIRLLRLVLEDRGLITKLERLAA